MRTGSDQIAQVGPAQQPPVAQRPGDLLPHRFAARAPTGWKPVPQSPRLRPTLLTLTLLVTGGCPLSPPARDTSIAVRPVAAGLTSPVGLAVPNDGSGRLFIVDQIGLIRVLHPADGLQAAPFLDIRDRMIPLSPTFDERGLLGLAFHPDYATNGRLFIYYSAPRGPDIPAEYDSETRLSEYRVSQTNPNQADAASERIVLRLPSPQFNHNGGQLKFGPDGFLYVAVGDGGGANDLGVGHTPNLGNSQDRTNLLGTLLRIDVEGAEPYAVPPDNPFAGDPTGADEIWAYGLRNPWRFSFDRGGQRRLFAADAGQDLFEEVSIIVRGGNYGWNIKEGRSCFDPQRPGDPPAECPDVGPHGEPLIDPIIEYEHTGPMGQPLTAVIIGGYVYRGAAIPELQGRYIFGDYSSSMAVSDGLIFAATEAADGSWSHRELAVAGQPRRRLGRFILSFGEDEAGELYVLTTRNFGPVGETGAVFRIESAP